MKYILTTLICVMLIAHTANAQSLSGEEISYIDSVLNAAYKDDQPGISFIVAVDGKPVYRRSIGMSDLGSSVKLTPETLMPIGSMSKQFAAACLLILVNDGKLSLNDDITKFLPGYNSHGKRITIENLLTHTSGVPSFTELKGFMDVYGKDVTLQEIISFFENEPLMFEPSEDWSYTNSGYTLIAKIIENISGMPYGEFASSKLIAPLGLSNTYIGGTGKAPSEQMAKGYEPGDENSMKQSTDINWSWPVGAGDVISNVDDLAKWDASLYNFPLISKDLLEKAWIPFVLKNSQVSNYGYGWAVTELNGMKFISHGGAIDGFLSEAVRIPGKKIYVAALSNNMSVNPTPVADKIAVMLAGIDTEDPKAITVAGEELQKYAGVYEMSRSGGRKTTNYGDKKMYRNFFAEGDDLYLQPTGGVKGKLIPYGEGRFYSELSKARFSFNADSEGNIVSMTLTPYPFPLGPVETALKTSLPLPESRKEIAVSEDLVKDYLGTYELMPGFNLEFLFEDGKFMILPTGQSKEEIFAETDTKFFLKTVDATLEFKRGEDGKVSSVILTQGQTYDCKKVK